MALITLELTFPPSANQYWRKRNPMGKGGKGMYVTKAAKNFKKEVKDKCLAKHVRPFTGPVSVVIYAAKPATNRDLDNTTKILLDAMQGFVYVNDKQVVEYHVYGTDAPEPKRESAKVIVLIDRTAPGATDRVFERMYGKAP